MTKTGTWDLGLGTREIVNGLVTENLRRDEAAEALAGMAGMPAIEKADSSAFYKLWAAGLEGAGGGALNEPLAPYQQSLWTYRCISKIQQTCKGIPLQMAYSAPGLSINSKSFTPRIARHAKRSLRPLAGRKAVCVGRAAEGELVESGPAADFFARPNSYQDWPAFLESHYGFLLLRGSVAWVMTDLAGVTPREMHAIDGRCIEPKFAEDPGGMPLLQGYLYTSPRSHRRVPLAPDEVKYFVLWKDSNNPFEGMPPGGPGRLAVATEYNASLFNASMLVNGSEIGLKIKFPQRLTVDQREEFRAALRQRNQGPARAKRELILEGGADAEAMSAMMNDLQFDQGKKTTRLEICCLYGVPPVVAGWVDAAGDSSAYTSSSLEQYYQETVFPLLDGVAPAIEEIAARFDRRLVIWFNVEDQPVVQKMRIGRIDTATKMFAFGVPVADIDSVLDLGLPDRPWYQTGFLAAGLLPAGDAATGATIPNIPEGGQPGMDEIGQPPLEEGTGDQSNQGPGTGDQGLEKNPNPPVPSPSSLVPMLSRIWKAWAQSWNPLARAAENAIRKRLFAQQRLTIEAVKRNLPGNRDQGIGTGKEETTAGPGSLVPGPRRSGPSSLVPAVKVSGIVGRILLEVFGNPADKRSWRARMLQFARDANDLGLRQALVEGGLAGEQLDQAVRRITADPRITAALQSQSIIFSSRIDDRTREILRRNLTEGLTAGEDARKLADRVQSVMGNRRSDAINIARNTMGQVLSKARHEGHLATGMTHKIWIYSRGPGHRRPSHVAAEARYAANPCPLDQPFIIDGFELMYPRDPAGPPEEIINCQCLQIARRLSGSPSKAAAAWEIAKAYSRYRFVAYNEA